LTLRVAFITHEGTPTVRGGRDRTVGVVAMGAATIFVLGEYEPTHRTMRTAEANFAMMTT